MNISKIRDSLHPFFRRQKLVQLLLLFSPSSKIQLVTMNTGGKFYADVSDPFPRSYFLSGEFDDGEFYSLAKRFLAKGGTFFDVGANFGFSSLGSLPLLPENTDIHLFEANPDIIQCLEKSKTLKQNSKIKVHHACLSHEEGVSRLNIVQDHLGSSYVDKTGTVEVKNLVIDEFIEQQQIEKVDFMKMDIEGSEIAALRGAKRSLAAGLLPVIYIEISEILLNRLGVTSADCMELLQKNNYSLFYCKKKDLAGSHVSDEEHRCLHVHGKEIFIAPVLRFPENHQTDILAIHRDAEVFKNPSNQNLVSKGIGA